MGTMSALERLRRYLDQERITYEVREHPVAYTAQEIAALAHVAGRRMAKVVMALAGEDLVMLVLPAAHRVSLEKLASALGGPKVRLAHEEEFTPAFPDCDVGAMPPFGNLYGLPVYVDSALAEDETIVSQAGTHRHTLEVAYADFERLVQPVVASLSDPVT
jgi:Ala-tRNA(Pro) deacylase